MKKIDRLLTSLCSSDLPKTKKFYTDLFEFEVAFESDWFIQLITTDNQLEIGIIDKTNEIVPAASQLSSGGFYITIVVDNADELYELAVAKGYEVIEEPKDTFYGQRRLLIKDPDGTVIDVSSPIPNFSFG